MKYILCFGNLVINSSFVCILFFQLSAEQRSEMWEHRQKAVQLEVDMQNMQKNNLMTRVKGILDLALVSSTVWSWVILYQDSMEKGIWKMILE